MNSPGKKPFWHWTDREVLAWLDREGVRWQRGRALVGAIASGDRVERRARIPSGRWNEGTGALCEEMETAGAGETAARFGVALRGRSG